MRKQVFLMGEIKNQQLTQQPTQQSTQQSI